MGLVGWGWGSLRREGLAEQALKTSAQVSGPGAQQAQGAPQSPTRPRVPAAGGEDRPGVGQQEAAAQPDPRGLAWLLQVVGQGAADSRGGWVGGLEGRAWARTQPRAGLR